VKDHGMTESLDLPPVLDLIAAPALLDNLLQRRGQSLAVDAGHVQRLGAQCLQVLLAARAAWEADGQTLRLKNPSGEFAASLELMGLSPEELTYQAKTTRGENDK
jgi:chemotaxis protein CheX